MNPVVASVSGVSAHPGVDAVVVDAICGAVVLEADIPIPTAFPA